MSSDLYLPRTLACEDRTYSETALLAASHFLVVLAEPGGGKTCLMNSLAQQLGASCITANVFRHVGTECENRPLVVDAYDELAKVEAQGIHRLLAMARKSNPTHVIISSRSSEWSNAETIAFKEFFGQSPIIARLVEFDEAEQRAIFEDYTPGEDFGAFQAEVARFDLDALLPNPQFLKLFADAYVQSGRSFPDKRSIFAQAVERLAKEANSAVRTTGDQLTTGQKVQAASEVFAKLLLSGAEGVTTSEAREERLYPLLTSLVNGKGSSNTILATRLFKPGNTEDAHRPVHKIVAEYAAADHLTKRIMDPKDVLSLPTCLAVIAPNSAVRDELRGLLGWMASLGNNEIQKAAVELDPYAVLANGDPSQLEPSSKRLLIQRLKEIEEKDPYFRRGDFWRRFSVAGFFTSEVIAEIKSLLTKGSDGHLRNLVLELLAGSSAITHLTDELRALALSSQEGEQTRLLAMSRLLDLGHAYKHNADLAVLIFEASLTSLKIAGRAIERLDPSTFSLSSLAGYFRVCAHLYPDHKIQRERTFGERDFVKRLVSQLNLATIEHLLDELTSGLTCKCGKKSYECDCRNGTSKIVGAMLDRYFELAPNPHDPKRIWQWVRNLNFHDRKGPDQSKAVEVLLAEKHLRQGIIKHAFGGLRDKGEIFEMKINSFGWLSHSGLGLTQEDRNYIVDMAFEDDNPELWVSFVASHQYHRDKGNRGPDPLRRRMREQALEKPSFMREWGRSNRDVARLEREHHKTNRRLSRRMKRRSRQSDEVHAANIKYVRENRALVESGRHWSCLVRFAELVLMQPDKIEREFGDEAIVRNALRNCLDFIEPEVPSLSKLAKLQCASQGQISETILYAACLEILRSEGNLSEVPIPLLLALKTNLDMGYDAVQSEEREALGAEINRLALSSVEKVELFCRQYLEPQLLNTGCAHTQVHWLSYDPVFHALAPTLAFEWLTKHELMPVSALDTLFEIAAQHTDPNNLKELVAYKCAEALLFWSPELSNDELEKRRTFWYIRAFYFLEDANNPYWEWLKSDKENVLLFNERSGRMNRSDHPTWPRLTSEKIEALLDAFFSHWPKVPLPSSWGTSSPKEETAYRFLTEVIGAINSDNPDNAIPSLQRMLSDARYVDLHKEMKSMLAGLQRQKALRDFEPPTPQEIVELLDHDMVVTVEGLRQLVLEELGRLQKDIVGGEFNTADRFYAGDERLDEEPCTRIIAERLNLILQPRNITVTPEHHLKHDKRCDFTTAKVMGGKRRLLVTEVKGQWHPKLFSAASNQLSDLYAIHPDAERQGIYLVIWYGPGETVAGRNSHSIKSAAELESEIESNLAPDLFGLIDVFVLDVSRTKSKYS